MGRIQTNNHFLKMFIQWYNIGGHLKFVFDSNKTHSILRAYILNCLYSLDNIMVIKVKRYYEKDDKEKICWINLYYFKKKTWREFLMDNKALKHFLGKNNFSLFMFLKIVIY